MENTAYSRPGAESGLGRVAREKVALHRWAEVRDLECAMVLAGRAMACGVEPAVVDRLKRDFDRVFPSPVRMLAFWDEVRDLAWAQFGGDSPWPEISAMARDLDECGRIDGALSESLRRPSPESQLLRVHAHLDRRWPDGVGGVDFVLQQGSDGGLWTSIPQWSQDVRGAIRSVQAGYLAGHPRWAVAIGCDGVEPSFLFGIDERGREMSAAVVREHVRQVKTYELPPTRGVAVRERPGAQ